MKHAKEEKRNFFAFGGYSFIDDNLLGVIFQSPSTRKIVVTTRYFDPV